MRIWEKHDIDLMVATELGLRVKEVRDITRAFLERMREHLADKDTVQLDGFGKFHMTVYKGPVHVKLTNSRGAIRHKKSSRVFRRFRVHFKKSQSFARLLRARYGPNSEKTS